MRLRSLLCALLAHALLAGCSGEAPGSEDTAASSAGTGAGGGAETTGSGGAGAGGGTSGSGGAGQGGGSSGSGGGGAGGGASWGPEHCPSPPDGVSVGLAVGDQLAEIVVKDCDGNDVSLSQLCGADALWIFAAHGWCGNCKTVAAKAEAIHDSFAGQNLASVQIVVETAQGGAPTSATCKLWRDQYGLEDVVTLYDPTGVVLPLWQGSSSLSAFLDRDRVITSKLVYDSNAAHIEAGIEGALGN